MVAAHDGSLGGVAAIGRGVGGGEGLHLSTMDFLFPLIVRRKGWGRGGWGGLGRIWFLFPRVRGPCGEGADEGRVLKIVDFQYFGRSYFGEIRNLLPRDTNFL